MRLTLLLGLVLLLPACSVPDVQGPRSQRLPLGFQIEGVGRITLNQPLSIRGIELAADSEPGPFHFLPRDRWYRLPVTQASGIWRAWAWVRGGTVGCVVAYYRDGRHYPELKGRFTQLLGPPLREDSTSNPVARWTMWSDEHIVWGVIGPSAPYTSVATVMLAQRNPRMDPAMVGYQSRCSEWQPAL
jgi:hypothetical protein